MPAKSKAQQALFGMALAVRKGEMKRSDVDKNVLDIVDGDMTNKEIDSIMNDDKWVKLRLNSEILGWTKENTIKLV